MASSLDEGGREEETKGERGREREERLKEQKEEFGEGGKKRQ